MEYEKTYLPMIIQKKKNYIGLKYEMDDERWKVDFKGIAVKRRNYCPLVKRIFWNVIYPSLGVEPTPGNEKKLRKVSWHFTEGPDRAVDALRMSLQPLADGQVAIDDLVITASLKSNYKNENLPHIQLAKRLKERDAGSAPQSGNRFGYVFVNEASRGNELSAKSEDPKFAKANNLTPDYLFYLDNQIRKPLVKFLALIGKQIAAEKVFAEVQQVLFDKLRSERRKLEAQTRATFFQLDPERGTKRPGTHLPVAPLKKPKKTVESKKDKQARLLAGTGDIKTFFAKPR